MTTAATVMTVLAAIATLLVALYALQLGWMFWRSDRCAHDQGWELGPSGQQRCSRCKRLRARLEP